MTRGELAEAVAREIVERGADRQWICSLLDRAIEVGRAEMHRRAEKALGPLVAEMLDKPAGWGEGFDMREHVLMRIVVNDGFDKLVALDAATSV